MKNKLILIFTLILILLPISMSVRAATFTVPIQYIETDSSDVSAWGFLNSLNGIMQFVSPLYFDSTAGGLQIVIYADSTGKIDTTYVPFQQYVANHAGGAGEANTLNDSGSFNNTEGFGLAGVKQGVALFLKGLVEGTNITITPLGDTAYSIAAAGGGGAGVWADTVGVLNAVWFIDSQNDTFLVIQDSIPGQVVIQAGQGQSLSIVADSATFGLINVNGSASGTIGLLSTTGGMVAHTVYDTLSDTTEFVWGQDGSAGQQVTTDGSGNFYFADAGSGVGYWDSTIVDNDSIVYQIVNVGAQGNDTLIEFIHDTSATDITYIQRTVGGRIDLKDIGEIYFDQITNGAWVEGKQWYDPEENAMTYYNNNSQMTIQLAQEMIKEVRNVSGDSIPDGTPVYQVDGGVTGHKPHVAAADADDSAKGLVFGVTTTAIGNNSDGYVAIGGAIHGLNTSAYTVGDELYLDTVAGGLTTSLYDINTGGVYRAYIGQVVVSHASTGVISINTARMPAAYEIPRLDSVVAVQIEDSLNSYPDTAVIKDTNDVIRAEFAGAVTHITSDGSDHTFIDQDVTIGSAPTFLGTNITGIVTGSVEQLHTAARKNSAGTIATGVPVYIAAYGTNWVLVEEADASDSAKMPAIGSALGAITSSATGIVVVMGELTGQTTDTNTVKDPIYVASGGGWTTTKPTGTNLIQKIGLVMKVNPSTGVHGIVGAGRTNDVPNIPSAQFWLGNASGVATPVTMSGESTMDNTGAVTNLSATVSDSTDAITDGSIDGDKLESNLKDSITTAYDHSQDATQAHSDYTRNVGDTVTGTYDFSDGNIEDVNKAIMDTVQAGVIDGGVSGATVKLPDGLTIAGDSIIDFTGTNLSVTNGVLNAAGGAGGTDSSLYVDSIMVEGNTETGITVTMNTVDTTMDFVVDADIVNHTLDTSEVITIIKDSMPPSFQGLIFSPTDLTDSLPIFDVGAKQFPGGIVIDSIQITIDADAAYSLQFMTYTNADPPVFDAWIDTVSTGATDQKAYSTTFTDGTVEVGKTVYIGIPATDIGWIKWAVFYHRP